MFKIYEYIVIQRMPENFEKNYLATMNRIAFWFFAMHVPMFTLIAFCNGTGPLLAAVMSLATLAGPFFAIKYMSSQRWIAIVMGVSSMLMGGLLVHFGQGPVQIEMHFYFFVLLALLAVFADPLVIIAAAVTAALHHAILWMFLPSSVFNYDAPFWVVGVHALFVVLESVAACFIARSFFDSIHGLEQKVEERTAALANRNRDMRTMLDAVQQGFFTIDRELKISEERSGAVDRTFGSPQGMTLPEFLHQFDSTAAEWTEFGLEDVFAEIMPVEVTIDQLPKRFCVEQKTYSIEYTPVYSEDELVGLAVVISDISATVEKESLESSQREMMAMIHRLAEDRSGFIEFFEEATEIVKTLKEEPDTDMAVVKRRVHTLKGITSIYDLQRVAEICHEMEDMMENDNEYPEQSMWDALFASWDSVTANLTRLSGGNSNNIELSVEEYQELLHGILNSSPKDEMAIQLASMSLEPTGRRLDRIGEQSKALANRLGKGEIKIEKCAGGLRTDSKHWSEFWSSFIHVVRNSVDHGLEMPEERLEKGKSEFGKLELKTSIEKGRYVISVSDDGNGINWEKVAELCRLKDIPCETEKELVDALFTDGLSTKEFVSETSGRGVGLAAVKECTLALGGVIEVNSTPGQGSEFKFSFPFNEMAPKTFEFLRSNNVKVKSNLFSESANKKKNSLPNLTVETNESESLPTTV